MSHAVNALDHALRADPQGLAFLEQTASLYVLDAASILATQQRMDGGTF